MGVAPLATSAVYHRQDTPFLTFPPAGEGTRRFGKGDPTHHAPTESCRPSPVFPAEAGIHVAPTAIPLPGPGGNQPNPKNHPNQTNHSSRPSRHPGYLGMGVSNLRSHSWAGGNLLSLRAGGYVDSGCRRKDGGDGVGVTWIPAVAGMTVEMGYGGYAER